jgi:hypothetical protein
MRKPPGAETVVNGSLFMLNRQPWSSGVNTSVEPGATTGSVSWIWRDMSTGGS